MKKILALFLAVMFVSNLLAGDVKKYGKNITLKEKTKVSQILENPKKYVGKKVLVEGTIVGVCSKRGCWMELAGDKEFQKIKIKVNDGEIVFPIESKGKHALVEGEVYELKLTKEEAIEKAKHHAEENKTTFDPSKITGPVTIYQIKGLGAEIK